MFNKWIFPDSRHIWTAALSQLLHQRSSWRLAAIFVGIIFAKGRKTVTSWFRAAGISQRYQSFYYFIGSIGRKTEIVATILFEIMVQRIYKNTNAVLTAIDDSPTVRYGPKVAGAGIHRNPTPTPDGSSIVTPDQEVATPIETEGLYNLTAIIDITSGTGIYEGVTGRLEANGTIDFAAQPPAAQFNIAGTVISKEE